MSFFPQEMFSFIFLTCSLKAEQDFAEEAATRADPTALIHGVL